MIVLDIRNNVNKTYGLKKRYDDHKYLLEQVGLIGRILQKMSIVNIRPIPPMNIRIITWNNDVKKYGASNRNKLGFDGRKYIRIRICEKKKEVELLSIKQSSYISENVGQSP